MSFSRAPSKTGVDRHAAAQIFPSSTTASSSSSMIRLGFINFDELVAQRLRVLVPQIGIHRVADLLAKTGAGPAERWFRGFADIHAGGTPSGFKTISTGCPSARKGHILLRHDLGNDALVAMPSRHLVAGLDLRFTATKTFTIFMTPGGNSSPRCNFFDLVRKRLSSFLGLVILPAHGFELGHRLVVLDREDPPLRAGWSSTISLVSLVSRLNPFGPAIAFLSTRTSKRRA